MNKIIIAGIVAGVLVLGIILAPLSAEQLAQGKHLERMVVTKTIESMQDPGQGHETHQIAILLPPKEGVIYSGRFSYTASAPLEVAVLHDMKPGDKPAMTYTIDGERKWIPSLIYPGGDKQGAKSGSMSFAGAALALHTLDGTEFSATVTLHAQARDMKGELPSMMSIDSKEKLPVAPIPDAAKGPAIDPEKGFLFQEIEGGLYWVTDGIYQAMFLTTGEGVIVVDAPPSIGENYLNAIAEVTDEPVTQVIYSHRHVDHIGAARMFPSDAVIIAHEETAAHLDWANDPNRPVPTITFDDTYKLEVGSQILELAYKGPAHEPGNIFIYAPEQKVLMLVDVIDPGWTPFKNLNGASDVPAYIQAHDQVLAYDFDTFIGGHVGRLGTYEDVEIQKEYIQDIQANARMTLQTVDFNAIAQQIGSDNPFLLFDTYLDTVAQTCADATVPKWIGRLAAVDVFTFDHCFTIMMSLRVD